MVGAAETLTTDSYNVTFDDMVRSMDGAQMEANAYSGAAEDAAQVAYDVIEFQAEAPISPELTQMRLLTEVTHLLDAIYPDGTVPEDVVDEVLTNLRTAVCEIAMPYAVSTTLHRVEHHKDFDGRLRRIITWLGQNVVAVTARGHLYHSADAAHSRVDVETDAVQHSQETLRAGIAQVFVEPKMSAFDAPAHIAKAEHLGDADSLQVSYAVTNANDEVIGRKLQTLLVHDVSLADWVAMFKDPNNIFGRAFDLEDEHSALSVMKLFKQLELSEDQIPEGPVTLVEAVLPYIADPHARASVEQQLARFRTDQERYREQAEHTAEQWLDFELELARSLYDGRATDEVARFIEDLADEWGEATTTLIAQHADGWGAFRMSPELAAVLEKAQQNILNSIAAVATDNEAVLEQMSVQEAENIRTQIQFLQVMREQDIQRQDMMMLQSQLRQNMARQNLTVGGGCPGDNSDNFGGTKDKSSDSVDNINDFNRLEGEPRDSNSGNDGISMKFKCPKGCPNTRRDPIKLNSHCTKCRVYTGCGAPPHMLIDTSPEALRRNSPTTQLVEALDAAAKARHEERSEQIATQADRTDRQTEAAANVEAVFAGSSHQNTVPQTV